MDDPLVTIAATLGKLEERSESAAERDERIALELSAFRVEVKEENEKRNGRIGSLERWRYMVTGGAVLAGLAAPITILSIRDSILDLFGL